jgi:hypothetical protein
MFLQVLLLFKHYLQAYVYFNNPEHHNATEISWTAEQFFLLEENDVGQLIM